MNRDHFGNLGFDSSHLSGPFSRPFWALILGPKWAHSTCLCTPNSPKVSLDRHIFDPCLTFLSSQNNPFSRHFVTPPQMIRIMFRKTHFWSQNCPFSRHLGSSPQRAIRSNIVLAFHMAKDHLKNVLFCTRWTLLWALERALQGPMGTGKSSCSSYFWPSSEQQPWSCEAHFRFAVVCLLACCLLAYCKPVGAKDTKEGLKPRLVPPLW